MNGFDVRVHAIRRRPDRRRPFEVRWHAAGRARSRSFITRRLADSYRAELVRAARMGLAFSPATGEPALWAAPKPPAITWYQHAITYVDVKWQELAPHSRASVADALATPTPALTRPAAHQPSASALRAALYGHAFNPLRRASDPDPVTAAALAWPERASLPITDMCDTQVIRRALDALAVRTDGRPAAANTISRKRAVFHSTLGYAAELSLLPANPLDRISWKAPRSDGAVNPRTVASPAQVHAILAETTRLKPDLTAFFACLYYAALRPEEAVALRSGDLVLPALGWGQITLARACPRTASAWSVFGQPYETRGLKHRPIGAVRIIPVPPILVLLLRRHLAGFGTTPDGRLFRGTRGGPLSESVYGRTWHTARRAALGPALAGTSLARRPYDLRHAALSLWLNASDSPAEVAARAGNSVHVLQAVYTHRLHGHDATVNRQIEQALETESACSQSEQAVRHPADQPGPACQRQPPTGPQNRASPDQIPSAMRPCRNWTPRDTTGSDTARSVPGDASDLHKHRPDPRLGRPRP